MFIPPDEPICLFFILDAKSLSATAIDRGGGRQARTGAERTGQRRGERRPSGCERRDGRGQERTGEGQQVTGCGVKRRKGQISGPGVHDSILQYRWVLGFEVDVVHPKTVHASENQPFYICVYFYVFFF